MSLNTCTISGNLGKAAELRYTGTGLAVVTFSVAVNERKRQQDGSYQDEANWFDCTMFGKRAEALQPYLGKGTKLALVGHLHKSTYEREVELMNTRRESQGTAQPQAMDAASVYDRDIPF